MDQILEKFSDISHCPIRNVVSRFSTKWGLLIIAVLGEAATLRFHELQKVLPDISPKVLTSTLKTLEADGLIHRKLYPGIPPKVEYSITPLGQELSVIVGELAAWAVRHAEEISSVNSLSERKK